MVIINNTTNYLANSQPRAINRSSLEQATEGQPDSSVNATQTVAKESQLRVIKVASDSVSVEALVSREQNRANQFSEKREPVQQYLVNQQLEQREEIDSLLGIDLFA